MKPTEDFISKFGLDENLLFKVKNIHYFDSTRKRMSVVVQMNEETDKYKFLIKGAPEIILDMCKKENIP